MCTVTFLPTGEGQFILTSNRDEAVSRARALKPASYLHNDKRIVYPKDGLAGGTWIGTSQESRLVCLLNGAFEKHERQESYRMSRGVVVKDVLACDEVLPFLKGYDLENVEPFSLVIVEWKENLDLWEFRWDGQMKFISKRPNRPGIWSSATLYTREMTEKREQWFDQWLKSNYPYRVDNIKKFHKTAGEGNPISNLLTERGFLKTVSITSIERSSEKGLSVIYEDLLTTELSVLHEQKPEGKTREEMHSGI